MREFAIILSQLTGLVLKAAAGAAAVIGAFALLCPVFAVVAH